MYFLCYHIKKSRSEEIDFKCSRNGLFPGVCIVSLEYLLSLLKSVFNKRSEIQLSKLTMLDIFFRQPIKLALWNTVLAFHISSFMFQLLHFQSSTQLTAWASSKGWFKFFGPCNHMADPKEAPSSWFWISSALIQNQSCLGVDEWIQDLSLCSSLYFK